LENRKIKFAIVGCGSIGKRHIAVLKENPDVELVAICDIDENQCLAQSDLYHGITYFAKFNEMLDSIEADIINVVTPHALHASMSIEALNKGFNVLVEKPMALTAKDCEEMISTANRVEKKLWVVKQNRYNVPVTLANNAIENGRLGKIFMVKCDILWNRYQGYYDDSPWRGNKGEEGGALFTQASHFIDLLIWWCGDIVDVNGMMDTQNHNIETEDSGIANLKFENGAMGSLVWTTCVYNKNYEGSITIIGEKGTIKIGGKYLNEIIFWDVEGFPLDEKIEYTDKPNSYGKYQGTSSNHDKVFAAIIANLQNKKSLTVEGLAGKKTVEAIEQIYNKL